MKSSNPSKKKPFLRLSDNTVHYFDDFDPTVFRFDKKRWKPVEEEDNNLNGITVSLEWAKKLKEAGWFQENSVHHWIYGGIRWEIERIEIWETIEGEWGSGRKIENLQIFSAPTAEEILRRLPKCISAETASQEGGVLDIYPNDGCWNLAYRNDEGFAVRDAAALYPSLANAAAAMWIYLKEHNLLP